MTRDKDRGVGPQRREQRVFQVEKPVQAKRQRQEFSRDIWGTVTNFPFLKDKVRRGMECGVGIKQGW